MEELAKRLTSLFNEHPLSPESWNLSYGTPGYRGKADLLQGIAIRIGAFACLRSIQQVSHSITTNCVNLAWQGCWSDDHGISQSSRRQWFKAHRHRWWYVFARFGAQCGGIRPIAEW